MPTVSKEFLFVIFRDCIALLHFLFPSFFPTPLYGYPIPWLLVFHFSLVIYVFPIEEKPPFNFFLCELQGDC